MERKNKIMLILGVCIIVAIIGFLGLQNSQKDTVYSSNIGDNLKSSSSIMSVYASLSPSAQKLYYKQSEALTKEVPERLVELDELTIGCFGPQNIAQMSISEGNLGGQCCGALKDIEAYNVQLKALEKFIEENGNISFIPRDPYDVTIEHAQQLISFDQEIQLTSAQQEIYNKAIKMSHHGGPCCCKCWKWYVMSGLAKKLIVDHGWDKSQIAELWDTSSSCGHEEDTNMHKHYDVDENEVVGGHGHE